MIEKNENINIFKEVNDQNYLKNNYQLFLSQNPNSYFLMFDIKKFKAINDTYGHNNGDKCLLFFYKILNNIFYDSLCVRLHGDEFVVITNHELNEINRRLDLMDTEIQLANKNQIIPTEIKYNCGVVYINDTYQNVKEKADSMMYYAKDNGTRLQVFNEEIWQNKISENKFITNIEEQLINNKLNYTLNSVYNYQNQQTNIFNIYTKNENEEPYFTDERMKLLKKYSKYTLFDNLNIQNILNQKVIKDTNFCFIIRLNFESLIKSNQLLEYFAKFKIQNQHIYQNLYLFLDIRNINHNEYSPLVFSINMLKNMGFKIIIGNVNTKIGDYIFDKIDVDYYNYSKELWQNSINNTRSRSILESKINLYSKYGTKFIFDNIGNNNQLNFLKEISNEKTLFSGHLYSKELVLLKENKEK